MISHHRPLTFRRGLALIALTVVTTASAEERFRVEPSGRGPQRLDVPPAFLSASARGDLDDLRLFDGSGREVPYLIVRPPAPEPEWAEPDRILPIPTTKTYSGFEVDLGEPYEVAGLEVHFSRHGFVKKVRVDASGDRQRWATVLADETLYDLPVGSAVCRGASCPEGIARRELRFEATRARWLRVVVDDRRTPRMGLPERARALLAAGAPPPGPTVPVTVTPRAAEPDVSRFAMRLPGAHLPVRALLLDVETPRLARPARLLEARLEGSRLAPKVLGSGALIRVERDGVTVSDLRVPIDQPEETELELVVEDGNNPRLALRGARVELAPLPWIFFESATGAPLEAQLGDPGRRAPRYDIEALRGELPRLRPAMARSSGRLPPVSERLVASPEVGEVVAPGAPLERGSFRFSRAIPAAPRGLTAVRLDASVMARSADLSDLRVSGADGRQIPFLLERRDEPLVVPLAPSPVPLPAAERPRGLTRPGLTVRELRLPEDSFHQAALVLETTSRVFTRQVEVYVEPDPARRQGRRERHGVELVASASWAHADPARPARALIVDLPEFRAGRLLVALDDGENAPLPISGARMLVPGYRIRFFHPGSALELLFGAPGLKAPRYDLALLAPRLRGEPAREVLLGAAPQGQGSDDHGTRGRILFWVVLGVAVVGLLALLARLLARGTDQVSG